METKIKDITGAEITVTDLKEAVRQCRECLASPYLMPSGHTNCSPCKGGNGNTAGNGRENTTRKKSDDKPSDFFVSRQSTAVWSPSFPCSSRPICPAMPRGEISEIEPHPPCVYMHVLSGSVRER